VISGYVAIVHFDVVVNVNHNIILYLDFNIILFQYRVYFARGTRCCCEFVIHVTLLSQAAWYRSTVVRVTGHFNGKLQNLTPRISQTL